MAKPIEIDAPDFLRPDQNFYDQEPFTTLPDAGISLDQTRLLISGMAYESRLPWIDINELSSFGQGFKEADDREKRTRIQGAKNALKNKVLRLVKMADVKEEVRVHAGLVVARHLRRYPLAWRYIQTQRDEIVYKKDGSVARPNYAGATESYARWASRQVELHNRLIVAGISEVFPQGIEPPRTVDNQVISGVSNPVSRRWRIVNAAEITRQS